MMSPFSTCCCRTASGHSSRPRLRPTNPTTSGRSSRGRRHTRNHREPGVARFQPRRPCHALEKTFADLGAAAGSQSSPIVRVDRPSVAKRRVPRTRATGADRTREPSDAPPKAPRAVADRRRPAERHGHLKPLVLDRIVGPRDRHPTRFVRAGARTHGHGVGGEGGCPAVGVVAVAHAEPEIGGGESPPSSLQREPLGNGEDRVGVVHR